MGRGRSEIETTDHGPQTTDHCQRTAAICSLHSAFGVGRWAFGVCLPLGPPAQKKRPAFQRSAFFRADDALVNLNILRIARADYPLRIGKAVHIDRDPAVIHEYEVRIPNQMEMVRPESLDEELFRMSSEVEHFAVTRPKLLHVYLGLGRARAHSTLMFTPVYVLSATLNPRLSADLCALLRFFLTVGRLMHFGFFRRRWCLRFLSLCLSCLALR